MNRNVWTTSTRSGSNGQCVQVRDRGDTVDVRDSKNPDGPTLAFSPAEWLAFIQGAKAGEFDQS